MAAIGYEVWFCNTEGRRLFNASAIGGFGDGWAYECVKVVNGVGQFTFTYPSALPDASLRKDYQVQFWRNAGGLTGNRLEFLGFIRYHKRSRDSRGQTRTVVKGHDQNGLLARRIVAYRAESDQATAASINVGDAMKDIINENFASGATDTDRDLSALSSINFTIAPDLADGSAIDKSFAWLRVTDVLDEMNQWSYTDGDEVFYSLDIANVDLNTGKVFYNFRTSTGQPGRDRTDANRNNAYRVLSSSNGALINEFYTVDARRERNHIYALGPEEGESRALEERTDTISLGKNASIFNRIEGFVDAAHVDPDNETAEVQAKGDEELARYRPKQSAGGTVLSIPAFRYPNNWGHGDKVVIDVFGFQFEGVIRITQLKASAFGEEEITGRVFHGST